jgi:RND family efflux transporter MFP subunit
MRLFGRTLPDWAKYVIPPAIVALGLLIMVSLIASRSRPQKKAARFQGALVEVQKASLSEPRVSVMGTGTVTPREQVTLMPQVSGQLDWVSPRFVAGGSFDQGELMVRVDQDDYLLAVQQAEAAVAQAQYQYDVAKANADIARDEWNRIQAQRPDSLKRDPDPLVLHQPQLRQAEASLQSARAALERARLNLERTEIRAPFNCRVRSETVSIGQVVGPQSQIGVVYGTDIAEIEVSISLADLGWIEIPGSEAVVELETGSASYTWTGVVDRSMGALDPVGRLARVVVQVRDPFKPQSDARAPELVVGSFVTVTIEGRNAGKVIPLPRRALHENSTMWVALPDSTLDVRKVTVLRKTPDEVLVSDGIEPGEKVVLTSVNGAADGMLLRPQPVEASR